MFNYYSWGLELDFYNEIIDFLSCYYNQITAVANSITTLGVIVALYTLVAQKRIHQIDMHARFQKEIRGIQEKLPPDINERVARLSLAEQRVVRMYWYAVFDEWFTCKKKSVFPELNKAWDSFAWGAKSAIDHLPIFAREFVKFRRGSPYLLGTHDEFFSDVAKFCSKNVSKHKLEKVVILFGTPCSGKSALIDAFSHSCDGWGVIKIDSIVAKLSHQITRSTFKDKSVEICHMAYRLIKNMEREGVKQVVFEAGCLFEKYEALNLVEMLEISGVSVHCFELQLTLAEAIDRAVKRNELIRIGLSSAIEIDHPEELHVFYDAMLENRIKRANVHHIPVDGLSEDELFRTVCKHIKQ